MPIVTDPKNFELMKERVSALLNFKSSQYSNTFLTRRVDVRLRATNITSYREYCLLLDRDMDERNRLYKELTINVTHFFRDVEMWEIFRNEVIPLIVSLKKESNEKTIKVWSAGASSGEEAISASICFHEVLGPDLSGFRLSILGTDLSKNVVESAKLALYEGQQFGEMKPELIAKYFDLVDHDVYRAKKEITDNIQFTVGDILNYSGLKNLDVIFCRNTVIYFNAEAKPKLYLEFFNCLGKGGFFVMGKTEGLLGEAREMFQVFNSKERIYFKE
jgi:chemotaxis protein methyltransferase CheR